MSEIREPTLEEAISILMSEGDRTKRAQYVNALVEGADNIAESIGYERDVGTFKQFIRRVYPAYEFATHNLQIIQALQRVADGEIDRLMIFAPRRHGKSELASRLFPAYLLCRFPHKWVGMASYGANLAKMMSRSARTYYTKAVGKIKGMTEAVEQWETGMGGGMWVTGVGGPATGKGFHYGIVDDPIKNAKEAASPQIRADQKDWWHSVFYSGQEYEPAIVIIQTRWNEDDLSGWLLREEHSQEVPPEGWHIVCQEALKTDHHFIWPPTCTAEEDERLEGEALWPEKYNAERLEHMCKRLGGPDSYFWLAMYQQRPLGTAGKNTVAKNFSSKNLARVDRPQPMEEILVGMDFNVDPMSLAFAKRAGNQIHFFRTIQIFNSNTQEAIHTIRQMFPSNFIVVYPDPSGKARKTVGGSDFALLRKAGFSLRSPSRTPPILDRVLTLNLALGPNELPGVEKKDLPEPRVYIDPKGCPHLVESLERLVWKPDTQEIDKAAKSLNGATLDHMFDACSYMIYYDMPLHGMQDSTIDPIFL